MHVAAIHYKANIYTYVAISYLNWGQITIQYYSRTTIQLWRTTANINLYYGATTATLRHNYATLR